jgi:hypothetical protein
MQEDKIDISLKEIVENYRKQLQRKDNHPLKPFLNETKVQKILDDFNPVKMSQTLDMINKKFETQPESTINSRREISPLTSFAICVRLDDCIEYRKDFLEIFKPSSYSIKVGSLSDAEWKGEFYQRALVPCKVKERTTIELPHWFDIIEGFIFEEGNIPNKIKIIYNCNECIEFDVINKNFLIENFFIPIRGLTFTKIQVIFDGNIKYPLKCSLVVGNLFDFSIRKYFSTETVRSMYFENNNRKYKQEISNGCAILSEIS